MDLPELTSNRISLIQLTDSGLVDMFEYSRMPEFYNYMAELSVQSSIEDTRQYLQKLKQRSSVEDGHYWFIKHNKDNKIIGTFGLLGWDKNRNSVEIGYGLSPHYWGQGYFQEILYTVLCFCFSELSLHRIWAKTQADNIPSIKALCRMGFKQEGVLRDYYHSSHDDSYYNAAILSILSSDFVRDKYRLNNNSCDKLSDRRPHDK